MSLWRLGDKDVVSQRTPSGVSHGRAGRAIRIIKISLYPGIFFLKELVTDTSKHLVTSLFSLACLGKRSEAPGCIVPGVTSQCSVRCPAGNRGC